MNKNNAPQHNAILSASLMPKIIKSKRISLRQLEPNQKNALMLAISVSENKKHLSEFMTGFCGLSDPQKALEKLHKINEKPGHCYYFIFYQEKMIGSICLLEDDQDRELQYWVRKDYEGNGFISEAVKAIEKEAFQHGKKPLMLMIDAHNIRSRHVAVKANFHPLDSQKTEWVKTYEQFIKEQQPTPIVRKWLFGHLFHHTANTRD